MEHQSINIRHRPHNHQPSLPGQDQTIPDQIRRHRRLRTNDKRNNKTPTTMHMVRRIQVQKRRRKNLQMQNKLRLLQRHLRTIRRLPLPAPQIRGQRRMRILAFRGIKTFIYYKKYSMITKTKRWKI